MGPTTRRLERAGALAVLVAVSAVSGSAEPPLNSPYREERSTAIRGLTTREIDDLREGRGMGLARAAEVNGYPGPRHVLDATQTGQLHLTPAQLAAVERLFTEMSIEVKRLGALILGEERLLEAAFRTRAITEPDLAGRLSRIATLQAELRHVHLRTHLQARALLEPHQLHRYDELRGYGGGGAPGAEGPPAAHH